MMASVNPAFSCTCTLLQLIVHENHELRKQIHQLKQSSKKDNEQTAGGASDHMCEGHMVLVEHIKKLEKENATLREKNAFFRNLKRNSTQGALRRIKWLEQKIASLSRDSVE